MGKGDNASDSAPPDGIIPISNSVYSLSEPEGQPEMEIVFVHGLQLSDYKQAYYGTWIAGEKDGDGKDVIWPVAWLGKEFPGACILSLSYDSSAVKTDTTGRMELYTLGEALIRELVQFAKVGQRKDCPIVFVCHSLGGIIAKEIIIRAYVKHGNDPKYVQFLENVRGFHFYATPHDGSKLADLGFRLPYWKGKSKLVEQLKVINDDLGRLNSEFERIGSLPHFANRWQFSVVAEEHKTTSHGFSALVVEETSARHGYQTFLTVAADHFGVCKPEKQTSSSYLALTEFIGDVMAGQSLKRVNLSELRQLV